MKRFVKRFSLFLIPFIVAFVFIELFIRYYPDTFNTKAVYIKEHKDVELLIFGSSHNQNAINPAQLNIKAANLAYGGQDLRFDSALFFKYVNELKNLKYVILELDYHTLEQKRPKSYFRQPWYYIYHGINKNRISFINKISLYSSSPDFFRYNIIRKFTPSSPKYVINKYGFVTYQEGKTEFEALNYDEEKIMSTSVLRLKNRHTRQSIANYKYNTKIVNNLIAYCDKNNIEVILVSTPLYKSYLSAKIHKKDLRKIKYIDSLLLANKKLHYYNFEKDKRFLVTDFKNDDHLNISGAKKFTEILNQKLDSL